MSNTPVTMNARRARTLLMCVRHYQQTLTVERIVMGTDQPVDGDLEPAAQMLLAALERIRQNEARIQARRTGART